MPDYSKAYIGENEYFGQGEAPLLSRFSHLLKPGGAVLDIGVGQGRNALPLAERGFAVTGIDVEPEAIRATSRRAASRGVSVKLWQGSFENFDSNAMFDGALVFGVLQELRPRQHSILVEKLNRIVAPTGLVFITTWHTGDPAFQRIYANSTHIEENCFRLESGEIRSYLKPKQVLEMFEGWEIKHHWEGLGVKHHHGDGILEQHGTVEFVGCKKI